MPGILLLVGGFTSLTFAYYLQIATQKLEVRINKIGMMPVHTVKELKQELRAFADSKKPKEIIPSAANGDQESEVTIGKVFVQGVASNAVNPIESIDGTSQLLYSQDVSFEIRTRVPNDPKPKTDVEAQIERDLGRAANPQQKQVHSHEVNDERQKNLRLHAGEYKVDLKEKNCDEFTLSDTRREVQETITVQNNFKYPKFIADQVMQLIAVKETINREPQIDQKGSQNKQIVLGSVQKQFGVKLGTPLMIYGTAVFNRLTRQTYLRGNLHIMQNKEQRIEILKAAAGITRFFQYFMQAFGLFGVIFGGFSLLYWLFFKAF